MSKKKKKNRKPSSSTLARILGHIWHPSIFIQILCQRIEGCTKGPSALLNSALYHDPTNDNAGFYLMQLQLV